jgi:hypothetical protein
MGRRAGSSWLPALPLAGPQVRFCDRLLLPQPSTANAPAASAESARRICTKLWIANAWGPIGGQARAPRRCHLHRRGSATRGAAGPRSSSNDLNEGDPLESSNHRIRLMRTTFLANVGQWANRCALSFLPSIRVPYPTTSQQGLDCSGGHPVRVPASHGVRSINSRSGRPHFNLVGKCGPREMESQCF